MHTATAQKRLPTSLLILILLLGLSCGGDRTGAYREVIVFVEATGKYKSTARDQTPWQALSEELQSVVDVYEEEKSFILTIYPIVAASEPSGSLFRGEMGWVIPPFIPKGSFDPNEFLSEYNELTKEHTELDVIRTLEVLRSHLRTYRHGGPTLVLYLSDMLHISRDIDLSPMGFRDVEFADFRLDYADYIPEPNYFEGHGVVDVLIRRLSTDDRGKEVTDFWIEDIFGKYFSSGIREAVSALDQAGGIVRIRQQVQQP